MSTGIDCLLGASGLESRLADFLRSGKDWELPNQMRILVMAPTRPLVLQHKETYVKILKLKDEDAVTLTGKTPAPYRKASSTGFEPVTCRSEAS